MKRKIVILGLFLIQLSICSTLKAQEASQKEPLRHELSLHFQGLGLSAMPFDGESWESTPGLSLGVMGSYTYWFGEHFGLRAGVRYNYMTHSQEMSGYRQQFSIELPAESIGYPTGSGITTVGMDGTVDKVKESQNYGYLEVPVQAAFKFGGFNFNLGVAFAKAVYGKADYSYSNPTCTIVSLPDMGIPTTSVPMTLTGATEGDVKNSDMEKPFHFLLAGDVGYRVPLGANTSMTLGLYGRWAPIATEVDDPKAAFAVNENDATYTLAQPSTTTLVDKIGYYEVGVTLGVNFGLCRRQQSAASEQISAALLEADSRYEKMASELEAMKAAQKKSQDELAAVKASQKKAEDELAALKNAQRKDEEDIAALKRRTENAAPATTPATTPAATPAATTPAAAPKAVSNAPADKLVDGITINFEYNETTPQYDATTEANLRSLCAKMQSDPSMKVAVVGHTDWVGTQRNNNRIGRRRANKVKQLMVDFGAPAENITVETRGERQPIDTNETQEGRHHNRRVSVELR